MFFQDLFWFLLWSFYFIAYLYVVIIIITDLFRDEKLNGWLKAVWIIALVFVPFLTALVYIIARGKGMAERSQSARGGVVPESDDYRPAASSTPADDIAKAKELLDAGTISQGEFDALKSKALGNQFFGA
ncbi:SHOCT domain-containing protein [Microbacterium allomyrinae]|jgi:Mn2+/Fe2+ NRAMP family transporter|uniref:SHOCT domain-containing protein n=1 Tax=Microbacterium allomyrinae TaxID=2830666 RepID=A0A9X1LU95_9MICO|nr:SHOCT domain-containing protein [Microbacterium allomyrinae]MCC2032080.1 SHOCT domain-containing protein [Microbacterium allomyrinae]